MQRDYDCCMHCREAGYDDGYIMLPIFRVKVCRNCGECHAVWGTSGLTNPKISDIL